MDLEYVGHVLARLRPLIRDGELRRSRLERVLSVGSVPADSIRADVERMLAKVGVCVVEDAPPPSSVAGGPGGASQSPPTPLNSGSPQSSLVDDTSRADAAEPPAMLRNNEVLAASREDRRTAAVAAARRLLSTDAAVSERQRHMRLLTAELEVGLALLMRGGAGACNSEVVFGELAGEARQAAEALFLHNQRLVYKMSRKYPATGMAYEDLAQFGFLGLIRAVEKFDPTAGFKFSTYATWWIRQSVTRGIADQARLIRFPVHLVERLQKVWRTRDSLTSDGESPSIHALTLATGLTGDQVREAIRLGRFEPLSLDIPVGPEAESTLGELLDLEDERLDPAYEVELLQLHEQLLGVLDTLTEREAGVIRLRFGLIDGEARTLDEIGQVYGVTRERIRQIELKAMSKLRDPSCSDVLEPYLYGGGRRLEAPQENGPTEPEESDREVAK